MSFKVVRNGAGGVVAFGPNEDWYEPGSEYVIEEEAPVILLTASQQLAKLDSDNALSQRNLRESIMLMAQAIHTLNPGVDLTLIPGVAKVFEVEAQASVLRSQI